MSLEISWRPATLVSALHAADALSRKLPLTDQRLAAALEHPAQMLAGEIQAAHLPAARFWSHLMPLAAGAMGRKLLIETAVAKTIGRRSRLEAVVSNLSAAVAAVETAVVGALPELNQELELRMRPLREQWEARGDGMLRTIGALTDESLIVPGCDVLLVHPALGGDGEAHLAYNSVRIEAVLANSVSELPEAVRLAWLIGQLQHDLPKYSESIHADRLPLVARYAMLPAALVAAEQVELVRFAPAEISRAVTTWRLSVPSGVDAAAIINEWWQTYQETRPPWNVALAALDQLIG